MLFGGLACLLLAGVVEPDDADEPDEHDEQDEELTRCRHPDIMACGLACTWRRGAQSPCPYARGRAVPGRPAVRPKEARVTRSDQKAVLDAVPTGVLVGGEWREAAENLGANNWQYWRYIGLPILLPSLLGTAILLFGNAFGAYATAFALTGGSLNLTPIVIGAQIRGDVLNNPGLGYALAAAPHHSHDADELAIAIHDV